MLAERKRVGERRWGMENRWVRIRNKGGGERERDDGRSYRGEIGRGR